MRQPVVPLCVLPLFCHLCDSKRPNRGDRCQSVNSKMKEVISFGNCHTRTCNSHPALEQTAMRRIVSKPTTKQITIVPTAKPPSSKRELHVALADHGLQQCAPRPRAQPRKRPQANLPPCKPSRPHAFNDRS